MKRAGALPFCIAAAALVLAMLAPIVATLAAVSPAAVLATFAHGDARGAAQISLAASALAVGIASLLGIPAAFALAHATQAVRNIALCVLALPLAFPPVASGIMLLQTVGTHTPLGSLLAAHGLQVVDSFAGVTLAEFFVAGSFVVIAATASFAAVDRSLEEAARTLGAGPGRIFFAIAFPLAAPGIFAGVLLAWMRAIGEYGATSIVAYHPTSLPIAVYVALSAQGIGPALALSYGFVVLALIVVALQWALRRRVV